MLVIAAVVLCGGVALLKSLAEKTALSFDFSLDGKALSTGKMPDVKVDGQPFTTGSKIGVGRHEITAQLQDAEPLDQRFWVVFRSEEFGDAASRNKQGVAEGYGESIARERGCATCGGDGAAG